MAMRLLLRRNWLPLRFLQKGADSDENGHSFSCVAERVPMDTANPYGNQRAGSEADIFRAQDRIGRHQMERVAFNNLTPGR
jgi:hypothetical protein